MRAVLQIRLTSPWLGDMSIEPGQGVFGDMFGSLQRPAYSFRPYMRDASRIALDLPHWAWAWKQVMPAHLHFEAVRMDAFMLAPQTHVSCRHYTAGGKRLKAYHQVINPNTVLTIGAEIVEPSPAFLSAYPDRDEQPSKEELLAALTSIGESLGVSPFLSTQDYARFVPLSIQFVDSRDGSLGRDQSHNNTGGGESETSAEGRSEDDRAKAGDR